MLILTKSYASSSDTLISKHIYPQPIAYFNADSAYFFIEQQVNFGPRVPNTTAHKACKVYLKQQLEEYADRVNIQEFQATAFNGAHLQLYNIIGSFNTTCKKRVLLAAHWDTRPFADKDSTSKQIPILGANDGASGVGILLEIARIINLISIKDIGIDIIFFDGEDYGAPEGYQKKIPNRAAFWCLGSQFWIQHLHEASYTAEYGILLDMVGSSHATFYQDVWSIYYANEHVSRIWNVAHGLGHGRYFINQYSGQHILDDHYFINKHTHIPTINIIDHRPVPEHCFHYYHHTHADNLELIDKQTLQAVGETVLQAICNN
jgi:hypothetical protein